MAPVGKCKRLLFMGSPLFAANVLQTLCNGASKFGLEIAGVVTQPNCKINGATPVGKYARNLNIPVVLKPAKPSEADFIDAVRDMNIDICLTVAYGGFLPQKFLDIPKFGVYNIHPSLLPLYRGAAPVQRCIGDNASMTGVTVLKTVLKMDAGPILRQSAPMPLLGHEKACELYEPLFHQGLQLFTQSLDHIFEERVVLVPQDHSRASYARKIDPSEGEIHPGRMTAREIFNRSRMLCGYMGLRVKLRLGSKGGVDNPGDAECQHTEVILGEVFLPTGTDPAARDSSSHDRDHSLLKYHGGGSSEPPYYEVSCAGDTRLGIRSLQHPTRKVLSAKEFHNGIRKVPVFYVS